MAPKTRRGRAPPVPKIDLPHEDWGDDTTYKTITIKYKKRTIDLTRLRNDLEKALKDANMDSTTVIPDEVKTQWMEMDRTKRAYEAAIDLDEAKGVEIGKSKETRAAEALWKKAETAFNNSKTHYPRLGDPQETRKKHNNRKEAEELYENFLYFQSRSLRQDAPQKVPEKGNEPRLWLWGDFEKTKGAAHQFMNQMQEKDIGTREDPKGLVTHDTLLWWVPVWRRRPGGLGKPFFPNVRMERKPYELALDEAGIEKRRHEVEDKVPLTEVRHGDKMRYETHSERREAEVAEFAEIAEKNNILREGLKNTRTTQGLYISANERPNDWPTSYDCLGIVKKGYFRKTLPEIENAPEDRSQEGETQTDNDEPENEAPNLSEKLNKFQKKFYEDYEDSTPWAEATSGRRELHVFGEEDPSSPVDSPPHSPINDILSYRALDLDKDDESELDVSFGTDESSSDAEESLDEGQNLSIPVDVPHPRDVPVLETEDEVVPEDPPVTEEERAAYIKKFKDHYGVQDPEWPSFRSLPKGEGFRVPYGPVDRATLLEVDHKKAPDINDPNLRYNDDDMLYKKPAPDGTSMQIVREILNDMDPNFPLDPPRASYIPANPASSTPTGSGIPGGAQDGSDDEGDLFTQSYRECSGTQVIGSRRHGTGGSDSRGSRSPRNDSPGSGCSALGTRAQMTVATLPDTVVPPNSGPKETRKKDSVAPPDDSPDAPDTTPPNGGPKETGNKDSGASPDDSPDAPDTTPPNGGPKETGNKDSVASPNAPDPAPKPGPPMLKRTYAGNIKEPRKRPRLDESSRSR